MIFRSTSLHVCWRRPRCLSAPPRPGPRCHWARRRLSRFWVRRPAVEGSDLHQFRDHRRRGLLRRPGYCGHAILAARLRGRHHAASTAQVMTDFNSAYDCAPVDALHRSNTLARYDRRPSNSASRCLLHRYGVDRSGRVDPRRAWRPPTRSGFSRSGQPSPAPTSRWSWPTAGSRATCFWVAGADVTMTTSAFSGNILAGANRHCYLPAGGSITLNGGTLAGRRLGERRRDDD